MTASAIHELQLRLRHFARAREWEQFHSPKNLSMALTVEAGELQEIFQWLTEAQSRELNAAQRQQVSEELADVLLYLCRLADVLDIDLMQAAVEKIAINARKYPVDKAKGNADKHL